MAILLSSNVEEVQVVHASSGAKPTQTADEVLIFAVGYQAKVKGIKPEVILSHEHTGYQWLSKSKALALDFGPDGGLHKAIIKNASLN